MESRHGEGGVSRPRRHGLSDGGAPQEQGRARRHRLQPHRAKAEAWVAQHGGKRAPTPEGRGRGPGLRVLLRRQRRRSARGDARAEWRLQGVAKGAVFIDNTTASAEIARELHAEAKKRGFDFLDAPVSGGQAGAENGVLTVMCGGDAAPYARAEPVIAAYARMCTLIGAVPVPASSPRWSTRFASLAWCRASPRVSISRKKAGLDIEMVMETISKGAAQSWQMENRYKTMNGGQVRFRLCRRLDAQGPRHLPRRGAQERREACRWRRWSTVLRRGAEDGRQALGYVEPDRTAGAIISSKLQDLAIMGGKEPMGAHFVQSRQHGGDSCG